MLARHAGRLRHILLTTLALACLATIQVAGGQEPDDTLSRTIPTENLIVYVEWSGLDAHPDAWKKTATARLLAETKLGSALQSLLKQTLDLANSQIPDEAIPINRPSTAQVQSFLDELLNHGLILAVSGRPKEDPQPRVSLVVRKPSKELRNLLEQLVTQGRQPQAVELAGRPMKRLDGNQPIYWWTEANDLVLHMAASPDDQAFVARLTAQKPGPVNETRQSLARLENGFQPVLLGWFDMTPLRNELPPDAASLGLTNLGKIDFRWGFEGEALRSILRVDVNGERQGLLALMDQPSFSTRDTLKIVPPDATDFTLMSIDAVKTYNQVLAIAHTAQPNNADEVDEAADQLNKLLGVHLRDDVLSHIGPAMMVRSGAGQPMALPDMPIPVAIPQLLVTAEVREPDALRQSLDKMTKFLNAQLAAPEGPGAKIEPIEGGYSLKLPPNLIPPNLNLSPTLLIGKNALVLATSANDARATLAAIDGGNGWKPSGEYAKALATLPERAIMMGVSNPSETVPDLIASLPQILTVLDQAMGAAQAAAARTAGQNVKPLTFPSLQPDDVPTADDVLPYLFPAAWTLSVDDHGLRYDSRESVPGLTSPAVGGVAIALLLPAVQSAREAARRAQCTYNEKQLVLALLNYESANSHYPAAAVTDKAGKPLLSWRVSILPYIEQDALYRKFHLDEPWDSEHNKALLKEMPKTYACPSNPSPPGMTPYRVATGDNAPFPMTKGRTLGEITDGTSNTIAIVEAQELVPWTQPDEFPLDDDILAMSKKLGSKHPGGIHAALLDGSIRFLKASTDPRLIHALFTPNGGEVIDRRQLDGPPPPARPIPPRRAVPTPAPDDDDTRPAALLPAVQAAREAARRAQCTNNLKQIMLALHNHHAAYTKFPAASIVADDGTPLLSWRVAILPYIEQQALYEQFRMNEPWDSPHNKALLKEMPIEFACPSQKLVAGMTHYHAVAGPGFGFEIDHGTTIADFADGTSNTIMIVEANDAVPWTKPDEPMPVEKLSAIFGSAHPTGYNVAYVDGSIHFRFNGLDPKVLKAMATRAGGEVISPENLIPKPDR